MFINGKDFSRLPLYTEDDERYKCIDALLDEGGSQIQTLLMRHHALFGSSEFAVPVHLVKYIDPEDGVDLYGQMPDLQKYKMLTELPKYSRIRNLGLDIGEVLTPEGFISGKYLDDTPVNYFAMNDLIRFKMQCLDDSLGKIKDLFFDPVTLLVSHYVVEISQNFSKKWCLVPVHNLQKIDWSQRICYANQSKSYFMEHLLNRKPDLESHLDLEQRINIDSFLQRPPTWPYSDSTGNEWRPLDF